MPFVVYHYGNNNDFKADDENYQQIEELTIEFYSDSKDFEGEKTIEGILKDNHIAYFKEEDYIDSEKMHMTTYTMEVLING